MLVQVKNLQIQAGLGAQAKPLVQGVSFSLNKGHTLAVVGESGSGKTLSALALLGLLPSGLSARADVLEFDDLALQTLPEPARRALRGKRLAMIFQEPATALNPVLTCGAQVAEMFVIHTKLARAARKARVLELFAQVQLPDPARVWASYPHQLSGGQRQRVMIAMALALNPDVLVADEPTTALDATVQAEIIQLVKNLQKQRGMAMLWITHDFGVVKQLADDVLVLQHGQVVENGPVQQVLGKPKAAYTQHLLAATLGMAAKPKAPVRAKKPLLTAENLHLTYPHGGWWPFIPPQQVAALDGVNIEIFPGETLGVVGESGSGKSTLARVLTRLATPAPGARVVFVGHNLMALQGEALRLARKDVQMVFQDPAAALNPALTVGETVGEGVHAHKLMPAADVPAYVAKLLAACGLPSDAATRYPHQFSGGQRQRICIARALALKPQLLICDEAVSALDVSVQAQILNLLNEIQANTGTAMLFISHDVRVISHLCHRVLVMKNGRVVESGPTAKVLFKPAQAYTKQLLAAVV